MDILLLISVVLNIAQLLMPGLRRLAKRTRTSKDDLVLEVASDLLGERELLELTAQDLARLRRKR